MPNAKHLKLPSAPVKQQIANKTAWNEARSADAEFFTIGYAGRKTEEIVTVLRNHGVRTLVDIRKHAVSMYRPDLSKGNLTRLIQENGMSYAHVPELGVPRNVRAQAIDAGNREVIWEWYDANVLASFTDLRSFIKSFEPRVALLCTEIDPHECHRHRLSLALEAAGLTSFDL